MAGKMCETEWGFTIDLHRIISSRYRVTIKKIWIYFHLEGYDKEIAFEIPIVPNDINLQTGAETWDAETIMARDNKFLAEYDIFLFSLRHRDT